MFIYWWLKDISIIAALDIRYWPPLLVTSQDAYRDKGRTSREIC